MAMIKRIISVNSDKSEITFEQEIPIVGTSVISIFKNAHGFDALSSTNLIKCIDCGHHVSLRSSSCVSCGCPINHSIEEYFNSVISEHEINVCRDKELAKARKTLYDTILAVFISRSYEQYERSMLQQKKKQKIRELELLEYDGISKISLETPLEVLEQICENWAEIAKERQARNTLLSAIPQNCMQLLEKTVNLQSLSIDELTQLEQLWSDNEQSIEAWRVSFTRTARDLFVELAKTISFVRARISNNGYEGDGYVYNVVWRSYWYFLQARDEQYYNSMTKVKNGELLGMVYIEILREEIKKRANEQYELAMNNRLYNDQFEHYYALYLEYTHLLGNKDCKNWVENYCAYKILKKAPMAPFKDWIAFEILEHSLVKNIAPAIKMIGAFDIVATTRTGHCDNQIHTTEKIKTQIQIKLPSGKIVDKILFMEYCKICKTYFITPDVFKELIKLGIIQCRLFRKDVFDTYGNSNFLGLPTESVLHQYGYNVNANQNLSASTRQNTLMCVINNGLYTPGKIIQHLNWLISSANKRTEIDMSSAITKWEEDILFLHTISRW